MISKAEQVRRDCYNQAVEALHRVDPSAVPIAKFNDPYAIPRVSNQARHTAAPPDPALSPENMLMTRVVNMQQACSTLATGARRNGVPIDPTPDMPADLGRRLQMLNDYHYQLEKKVTYYSQTTREQRAIDELRADVGRMKKAMVALGELLPLLMAKAAETK
jgi:hypothetical protein